MRLLNLLGDFPHPAHTGMHVIRLHLAWRKAGLDSRVLYRERRLRGLPPAGPGTGMMDAASARAFRSHPFYRDADILHFHCLPGDALPYLFLSSLARDKPSVLSLHDLRAFTGRCGGCSRRDKTGERCAACEAGRFQWLFRRHAHRCAPLLLVSTGRWMSAQLPRAVLDLFPVYEIPYGVNVNLFQPLEKAACRARLNLPQRKKILAACPQDAAQAGSLLTALDGLPASLKKEILLLTLGTDLRAAAAGAGVRSVFLGTLGEDYPRAIAFSAADLFIAPLHTAASTLRMLESMACGTPVVAADSGEAAELVRAGASGVAVEAGNAAALRASLSQLLPDDLARRTMGAKARAMILKKHTLSLQVSRYRAVFAAFLSAAGQASAAMPLLPLPGDPGLTTREHD